MSGALFSDRRLAEIYDALHPDRSDLDPFLAIVDELAPDTVLDLGCGTGTLACLLADRGIAVVFGARNPVGEPWLKWNAESTFEEVDVPGVGLVRDWLVITETGPLHFSFRWTFVFERDGTTIDWDATFAVRTQIELVEAVVHAGFNLVDVREDEFIFIARRAG